MLIPILILLLIDPLLLLFLVRTIGGRDVGFSKPLVLGGLAGIGTVLLMSTLSSASGGVGFAVGAVVLGLVLGVIIVAVFPFGPARSMVIGGMFVLMHYGLGVVLVVLFPYLLRVFLAFWRSL